MNIVTRILREYEEDRMRQVGVRGRRFPTFAAWLETRVREMVDAGETPAQQLASMSRLPSRTVKEHPSIWAYGYHFRPDNEEDRSHVTYDAGVAAIISQVCQSSSSDPNPVVAALKYVGVVKKIAEINYGTVKYNVMKCSWIRPDWEGNPTMRVDEDGFCSVKFRARQVPAIEPYILPRHAQQVHQKCICLLPVWGAESTWH